jgi:hypothetical protein
VEALTRPSTARCERKLVTSSSAMSRGVAFAAEKDEPADPPDIRLLCAKTKVPGADGGVRLVEEARRPGNRGGFLCDGEGISEVIGAPSVHDQGVSRSRELALRYLRDHVIVPLLRRRRRHRPYAGPAASVKTAQLHTELLGGFACISKIWIPSNRRPLRPAASIRGELGRP